MIKKLYTKIFKLADYATTKNIRKMHYQTPFSLYEGKDLIYGKNNKTNRFDIYYPKIYEDKKLPTILNIHGGGYVAGSKENESEFCRRIATKGFCVINMEYTLADKEGFPKPVFEVFDLFNFIENNSSISSHIDYDNFFIAGDSAGGHIASTVANIQCNEDIKKVFDVNGGPKIKGLILNSPVFGVFKFGNLPILKNKFEEIVFGDYKGTPIQQYCHNFDILSKNFPSTIIFSANNDILKFHTKMFCKRAKKLGLNVQSYNFTAGKSLGHDFIIYNLENNESKFAINQISNFIIANQNNQLSQGVNEYNINLKTMAKTKNSNKMKEGKLTKRQLLTEQKENSYCETTL